MEPGLFADNGSVRWVKTISLEGKREGSGIKAVLLGRRQRQPIKPASICRVNPRQLCVTDAISGTVILLDNNGKIKKRITHVKGVKLISPVSACVDDKGNLYVSDTARQAVPRFDSTSKYKFKGIFISPAQSGFQGRITGIAFAGGNFYCVDTPNHRVLCFDRQGKLQSSFGKRGTAGGEFNFPTHIAVDKEFIYVTDALNFRCQVFDYTGKFIRSIGTPGRGGGNFSKPKGIAVDSQQRIFVADAMFDNVQIFDFQGRFLYYFGAPGQEKGQFWMPSGIMIDHDGAVWVADTYNNRLQVFKVVEKVPGEEK